jgi:PAS domain S-box-containing protein
MGSSVPAEIATDPQSMELSLISMDDYQALVDSLPLGVYRSDQNGQILYANAALAAILEYDSVQELKQVPAELFYDDSNSQQGESQMWRAAKTFSREVLLRTQRGNQIWVRDAGRAIFGADGKLAYSEGVIEDITARKQADEDRARLNLELERRNRTLEALYEIGIDINAQLNMRDVPRHIIERAMTLLEGEGSFLYLYDPRSHLLRVQEAVGRWEEYIGRTLQLGEGLAGRVFQSRRAMVVDDYASWDGRSPNYEREQLGAVLCAPLLWGENVLGTLSITADAHSRTFGAEDVRLAEMLATQAAQAMVNARHFETEHRQREIAETLHAIGLVLTSALELSETLRFLVQTVQVFFPQANNATVQLLEKDGVSLRTAASAVPREESHRTIFVQGEPIGIAGRALAERRVINVPDVLNDARFVPGSDTIPFHSLLVAPLMSGDRIWGTLSINAEAVSAFSSDDESLADLVARQASVAIENAQLYEEIQQHVSQLEQRVEERTQQLQRIRERAEALLAQSSDAIILAHADGAIQQANPAFYGLFRYQVDELFGSPLQTLVDADSIPKLAKALQDVAGAGYPARVEITARRKDGTDFAADMALSPIVQHDGQPPNVMCSIRDMTVRRQMEENLRKALEKEKQLVAFKSRFGSMVSHEFRTPLAIILSSSNILKKYGERLPEQKRREHLEAIEQQVRHLNQLLEDILTISRAETVGLEFKRQPVNMVEFCRDVIADVGLTTHNSHQIVFSPNRENIHASVDGKLLRQAITNLLTNAVKYSPEGGSIVLQLVADIKQIIVCIHDNGIGIPPQEVGHIFEAFHRADNVGAIPGTGLGLAITKLAVEMHGGIIDVESEIGRGTTFTLRLPWIKG